MPRLFALLAALALAGCVTQPQDGAPDANMTTPTPPEGAAMPAPIEDSKEVTGSVDPSAVATGIPCEGPSTQCFRYPFDLNVTATIHAELTWTMPASDFDLYVFQDGAAIDTEGATPPPGTSETYEAKLEPGAYELVVSAYGVARDTYTLNATFS